MILSNCGCSPKNICRIFWWSSRKAFSRCSGGPTRKVPLTASPYFAQEDLKNRLLCSATRASKSTFGVADFETPL